MELMLLWLFRYGHVLGAGIWVGGYALLALIIVPALEHSRSEPNMRAAHTAVRVLTYSGMATIFFGVLLITRTRGFASLIGGEWGSIVLICVALAVALLGIGDGALRPALRRLERTGDGRAARRYAWIGFVITIIAIGLMTRALYART